MRRLSQIAAVACCILFVGCGTTESRCSPDLRRVVDRRVVMGGEARIVTYASDVDSAMQATRTAFGVMARIEDALSDYRERSEVETIVRTVGAWQTTGPDLRHALFVSDRWRRLSGGAFDPAIGATTRLWRRARRVGIPPSPGDVLTPLRTPVRAQKPFKTRGRCEEIPAYNFLTNEFSSNVTEFP